MEHALLPLEALYSITFKDCQIWPFSMMYDVGTNVMSRYMHTRGRAVQAA